MKNICTKASLFLATKLHVTSQNSADGQSVYLVKLAQTAEVWRKKWSLPLTVQLRGSTKHFFSVPVAAMTPPYSVHLPSTRMTSHDLAWADSMPSPLLTQSKLPPLSTDRSQKIVIYSRTATQISHINSVNFVNVLSQSSKQEGQILSLVWIIARNINLSFPLWMPWLSTDKAHRDDMAFVGYCKSPSLTCSSNFFRKGK